MVVTGMGPITAASIGKTEFWNFLLGKQPFIQKIPAEFENTYTFKSKFYVPFPEVDIPLYDNLFRYPKLVEKPVKIAALGMDLALTDAALKSKNNIHSSYLKNAGVILGIGIGFLETAVNYYVFNTCGNLPEEMRGNVLNPRFNRMVIPISMPNSVSSWLTILHEINGFNYTINSSCASGTIAIGEAFRKIRDGYSDIIITGGVECLKDPSGSIMKGFDILGALTKSSDGYPMPFSNNRSGFLFSEGACCILILEELEKAKKRGAPIYAEIVDFQSNSDGYNIVQIQKSGEHIYELLLRLIGNRKIDYINTHGTGTELNDIVERKVIKEIFGDKKSQPVMNSTKSILGHSIGASGALEAAATVLSIKNSLVHAHIADDPFDDLNLAPDTTKVDIDFALSASYGFGGHNGVLLFRKYP